MTRILARCALTMFAGLIAIAYPHAQQAGPDPWYSRQPRSDQFDGPKVFTGAFSVELPKNWQLAPGHTGTLFSVVEKTRRWETAGFITLEYMRLQAPLDPTLIAGALEREAKEVQIRELAGKQFAGGVKVGPIGPIIFVQYSRVGVSGTDDRVTQYSIPVGTTMYRLICIAPAASVEKYRPLFAHVAASFTPIKTGS